MEDLITGFIIGPRESDYVCTEDILMKLALAETAIQALCNCLEKIHENDGVLDYETNPPPDVWAITGMSENIRKVSHALKCGCWGYQTALMH